MGTVVSLVSETKSLKARSLISAMQAIYLLLYVSFFFGGGGYKQNPGRKVDFSCNSIIPLRSKTRNNIKSMLGIKMFFIVE